MVVVVGQYQKIYLEVGSQGNDVAGLWRLTI